jgi:hypothetical protein
MKKITFENLEIIFHKKYYIMKGNNGNHTGYNRKWTIFTDGYNLKRDALKVIKEVVNNNGDMKYGLTPIGIFTPNDLIEKLESKERLNIYRLSKCFDISINDKENETLS